MALSLVVALTSLAVCIGLVSTCGLCLDRADVRRTRARLGPRLLDVAPYLGGAALFFVAKRATHGLSLRISHALDWDITAEIYAVEGDLVAVLQDVVPEATVGFFSAMYMFGFPYLLVTAPILYFAAGLQRRLKELLVAYLLNYLVGSICYTLFIAYGPRNHLSTVDGLMYQIYPQTQDLTAAVSANTDVFPSLHTSLAVVVLLFAWRSRADQRLWFSIASVVAASVVFSTMYLGIHWAIDVVAGVLLAGWSVAAAERLVNHVEGERVPAPAGDDAEDGIASETDVGD
ncbi:phosphatase PAP2 family protein [Halopiger xanaduensis]|uniref:Phosphoesterase PA-phosphatase related protein n=1 Tax=Halopiger xanaduensis (strain DSM 18323 / JCM 14033 / SH-6) TaxID=797210 RepID=F8D509_HALXS|nr:phosphatase PAP2 family protein [Halopiger xanaduensis]AEH38772.1 phosphoesterase PA-phosphatase related protein [Halopiger xanaduensis SH-6]